MKELREQLRDIEDVVFKYIISGDYYDLYDEETSDKVRNKLWELDDKLDRAIEILDEIIGDNEDDNISE